MNLKELRLHKPVKIIYVYCYILIYDKQHKPSPRKKGIDTGSHIQFHSGNLTKDTLYLPADIFEQKDLNNIDLILLIQDRTDNLLKKDRSEEVVFLNLSHPKKFKIFEFSVNGNIELHLKYDHFEIGEPAREDFKLCDLKPSHPVEVKINGKLDFSLTSRRARTYKEQIYIFDVLGEVDQIKSMDTVMPSMSLNIPSDRKVINLLKPLW